MESIDKSNHQVASVTGLCTYTSPGGQKCSRKLEGFGHYCVLHGYLGSIPVLSLGPLEPNSVQKQLKKEVEEKNGDWQGVRFPPDFKLPQLVDFPVDARWASFNNASFDGVRFEKSCYFSDSKFVGDTEFKGCQFVEIADFKNCTFENKVEILNSTFHGATMFYGSVFVERATFRARFVSSVNFNDSIFKDAVTFSGWRNISSTLQCATFTSSFGHAVVVGGSQSIVQRLKNISNYFRRYIVNCARWIKQEIRKVIDFCNRVSQRLRMQFSTKRDGVEYCSVFEKEGQFQNVIFYKPEQVVFRQVNMACVYVQNTNFRGARFLAVNWSQPKLNRNGLYDEIFIRGTKDAEFIQKHIVYLEESYRNIRAALEDNLNYSAAADFYVGEMESYRAGLGIFRRHMFSVVALYRAVSNYGTSVATALRMLLWILLLHWAFSLYLNYNYQVHDVELVLQLLQRSFALISFQSLRESGDVLLQATSHLTASQKWFDIGLKLLGVAQLAMLVFAFRTRIKRH